jgi:hypothetical protein
MAMLTHTSGAFERTSRSLARPDTVRPVAARLATIKRWGMHAVTLLVAASALIAIIGLQAAIYLWCFKLF